MRIEKRVRRILKQPYATSPLDEKSYGVVVRVGLKPQGGMDAEGVADKVEGMMEPLREKINGKVAPTERVFLEEVVEWDDKLVAHVYVSFAGPEAVTSGEKAMEAVGEAFERESDWEVTSFEWEHD